MQKLMMAMGVIPKMGFMGHSPRSFRHLIPKMARHPLKQLTVGRGVGERRSTDAEIARAVEMSGGAVKPRRHAPLKFRM